MQVDHGLRPRHSHRLLPAAYCPLLTGLLLTARMPPQGFEPRNLQIMRRFEGHQQGETKRDNPVFTESAAVKVRYILLRKITPSRHNRAILILLSPVLSLVATHREVSFRRRRCSLSFMISLKSATGRISTGP